MPIKTLFSQSQSSLKESNKILQWKCQQYTDGYHSNILSFANNIHTYEGGTHESGFKTSLTRVINDYARKQN